MGSYHFRDTASPQADTTYMPYMPYDQTQPTQNFTQAGQQSAGQMPYNQEIGELFSIHIEMAIRWGCSLSIFLQGNTT